MAHPVTSSLADKLFGIHDDAMRLHARRLELIASNIANADTPGYKAQALNFEAALNELSNAVQSPQVNNTLPGPEQVIGQNHVDFRTAIQPSLDGNSVDVSMEQADFADASLRYQASMQLLEGRIKSLLSALRME